MAKIWTTYQPDPQTQAELSNALNIHPVIAQVLINRKITDPVTAEHFLKAELSDAHDPFLLKGMDAAVERIRNAVERGEKVLVYGDYDVDGVTSSAVMNKALLKLGLDVIHHIPHRMTDGYGLNAEIAQYAHDQGVSLLITVDCGITAYDEVEALNALNVDVIVIDHHETDGSNMPNAVAIVNPKQPDCPYPFKELASVGLAAKVTQALHGGISKDILDLVAIGTVADVVPLYGENRIFVKNGMPLIIETQNHGLRALLEESGISDKKTSTYHIGFVIGPRINACGRMDTALKALDLFLAKDRIEARQLARELNEMNSFRQKTQRDIVQEAMTMADAEFDPEKDKVLVLYKEGWHKGVLGIVASRLADKYYRPSVVISTDNGVGTASCRSIDGFHLHDALSECSEILENFGGHEGAAGLTIRTENIDPFRKLINDVAGEILEPKKLEPTLAVDAEVALSDLTLELAEILNSLEPYGEGNPAPVLCIRGLIAKSPPQVLGRETLKFWVTDGVNTISAVGFGMAKQKDLIRPGQKLNLAFELSIDAWNKAPVPQLKLKDIQQA